MTDRTAVDKAAKITFARRGYWGLSFFTRPGLSAVDIARAIVKRTKIRKGKLRSIPLATCRDRGWEVADLDSDGHFNLKFPTEPNQSTWDALDEMSSAPEDFDFGMEEET